MTTTQLRPRTDPPRAHPHPLPTPEGQQSHRRIRLALGVILVIWVAIVTSIARADGFATTGDGPPLRVLAAVVIPLTLFFAAFRTDPVRHAVLTVDPRIVLSLQLWRIVGVAFLFGWTLDDLPASFALPAGIGDVGVGVAAFLVLARLLEGALTRLTVIAFTALGIGDFVVAVVGGAIIRPEHLEDVRWVLFPALAVPFFAMVHAVTWAQLVSRSGGCDHGTRPRSRHSAS